MNRKSIDHLSRDVDRSADPERLAGHSREAAVRRPGPAPEQAAAPPASSAERAPKSTIGSRALALLVDAVIAWVLGLIPLVGYLISASYLVLRDGFDADFMRGRSMGKRLTKLTVVRMDGGTMDFKTSVRRNWMFGLGAAGALLIELPYVGWLLIPLGILIAVATLLIGIIEVVKVLTDGERRRWGDQMAATKVVQSAG